MSGKSVKGFDFVCSGKNILIEAIIKDDKEVIIHLPDGASKVSGMVDLVVVSRGEEVERYEVEDKVMCPIPSPDRMFKFDAGLGERQYIFYEEDEILGKFK